MDGEKLDGSRVRSNALDVYVAHFFKARECSVILESNEGDSVIVVEYRGISEIYPLVYAIFEYPIT